MGGDVDLRLANPVELQRLCRIVKDQKIYDDIKRHGDRWIGAAPSQIYGEFQKRLDDGAI